MQFTSRDVAEVQSTWQQFVPSAALQKIDPHRFRFDWRSADLGSAMLVRYELAAQVHSLAEPHDQLLVCRVDAPDAQVWSGRDTLDARAPWLSDGSQVQARWHDGARVRALVFDRTAAEARARQLIGDDTLQLRSTGFAPHSPSAVSQWEKMFRYLDTALGNDTDDDRIMVAEFERHALMVTLATFPTSLSDSLRRPVQRTGAPATVRRALTYIDENAHLAITIDDVARASFISTRGLQYAFRRALDTTPTVVLRRARLDGARRDLERGERLSVSAVARRWGFSNPSRFAIAYREAFGVAPTSGRSAPDL
ncbi:helix-turn-helix transcriptional regulator [Microbacterium sp. PMB16]|uniref:helix-turn-helix transcriptional regulator n=1 Tax=Microbacterium sp. PMB16 TaxID=3120157 RepID=UPI003F4BF244